MGGMTSPAPAAEEAAGAARFEAAAAAPAGPEGVADDEISAIRKMPGTARRFEVIPESLRRPIARRRCGVSAND